MIPILLPKFRGRKIPPSSSAFKLGGTCNPVADANKLEILLFSPANIVDALQGIQGILKKPQTEGISAIGDNSYPPQLRFNTKSRSGSDPAIAFSTNVRTSKINGRHFKSCIAVNQLEMISLCHT